MTGTQSRPVTNYLGDFQTSAGIASASPEYLGSPSGVPSDAELERAVQEVLRDIDLTVSSKRGVRTKLEEMFGLDLASRKAFINAAIDRTLASQ
jgi:chitin synthase